tara:strand:+ start:790 stop:1218 length:429 start_codon:yes stop_codon:yes gene_type:complete
MIKYSLICNKCNSSFESWFASSNEFEKLKRKNFLNCHNCGSLDVKKSLMAPSLINKKENLNNKKDFKKLDNIKKTLKEYQKFIKNNFEYVGENFAYEARSIHYDNKKKEKGIYGTASKKDLEDLREEGIETKMVPWIEDDKN